MKSFFLSLIKFIFALLSASLILFFVFIALILGIVYAIERPAVNVEKDTVLVIDLATTITDSFEEKEFRENLEAWIQGEYIPKAYLLEVIEAIEEAAKDSRIIGIYLKGNVAHFQQDSGYPILHEVRKAIDEFKKTGKLVVAYFVDADVKDYFLGSVANKVIMNPIGQLSLKGLSCEMMYFAEAFKKYGIGVQVTKVGKYKSAIEPFVRDNMSEPDKEQLQDLLTDIWGNVLDIMAKGRQLEQNFIKELSNKEGLFLASIAKDYKLIDDLGYQDEAFDLFKAEHKSQTENDEEKSSNKISLKKYIRNVEQNKLLTKSLKTKPQVGILYAEGEIVDGEGHSYEVGSARLERKIDEIREDDTIKAVVLRVNSVGGGVHASESIQRALQKLQSKKPIVASFGTVAASGGYWISCLSDAIYTDPMCITGSIGVFGLLFNVQDIAKNIGIHFDRVITGPFAGMDSYGQPKTAKEMAKIQANTDLIYNTFLAKVAQGRKMDLEKVESLAQGRVWSGLKAKEIGLADFYGGIKDAANHAAKLANLGDNWETKPLLKKREFAVDIIEFFQESPETKEVSSIVTQFVKYFKQKLKGLSNFNDPSNLYARMPNTFRVN